jgi:AraC-like DNA-binding protein
MKETPLDDFIPDINYQVFRKCRPEWRLLPGTVKDYDFTYIVEGKARYTIDGEVCEVEAGDLICLTKGTEKEAATYAHSPMCCFAVNFSAKHPPVKAAPSGFPKDFPAVSHIGLRQDLVNLFRELTISWAEQQNGYICKSRALLMLILHRLCEIVLFNIDSAPGDYRVKKVTRYISMHFSEKLTVKALADMVNLNTTYFGGLFKKETGGSVHQYLTKIRVRNAENLLQSGNFMVKDAAELCGFSDVIHFYRLFRALRGFPPSRCIPRDSSFSDEEE